MFLISPFQAIRVYLATFGLHAVLHPVEKSYTEYCLMMNQFLYYHAGRVAFLVPLFQHYKIVQVRYTECMEPILRLWGFLSDISGPSKTFLVMFSVDDWIANVDYIPVQHCSFRHPHFSCWKVTLKKWYYPNAPWCWNISQHSPDINHPVCR